MQTHQHKQLTTAIADRGPATSLPAVASRCEPGALPLHTAVTAPRHHCNAD